MGSGGARAVVGSQCLVNGVGWGSQSGSCSWADPWRNGWGLQIPVHRASLIQSLEMGSRASWRTEGEEAGGKGEKIGEEERLRDRGRGK